MLIFQKIIENFYGKFDLREKEKISLDKIILGLDLVE